MATSAPSCLRGHWFATISGFRGSGRIAPRQAAVRTALTGVVEPGRSAVLPMADPDGTMRFERGKHVVAAGGNVDGRETVDGPPMGKGEVRRLVRDRLRLLADEEAALESAAIARLLVDSAALGSARHVMAYLALPGLEVDTTPLLRACLIDAALGDDLRISVPRMVDSEDATGRPNYRLEPVPLVGTDLGQLASGDFPTRRGVVELPDDRESVDIADIDVVLVPGAAFDANGGRCGRGKGYYDGFLTELRAVNPALVTVGLALRSQLVYRIPREPHDVILDAVVTADTVTLDDLLL